MERVSRREVRTLLGRRGIGGWRALVERFGPRFWMGREMVTAVPDDIAALLRGRVTSLSRARAYRAARLIPGADGILFSSGSRWKTRASALMRTMSPAIVQTLPLNAIVDEAVEAKMRSGPDLHECLTAMSVDVALRAGYNLDLSDPSVQDLGRLLRVYKALTTMPDERRRLDVMGEDVGSFFRKALFVGPILVRSRRLIQKRMVPVVNDLARRLPEDDPDRIGWFRAYLEAGLTGSRLATEVNHLYGASTAAEHIIGGALVELAAHPEWADRIAAGDKDALEAVMAESYRMYPAGSALSRQIDEEVSLGGVRLPVGTQVILLLHAVHRDPELWPEPDRFLPERWAGPPRSAAEGYAPFISGRRRCLGESYARRVLARMLYAICSRYRVQTEPVPMTPFLVPRFSAPMPFRLLSRGSHAY